MPFVTQKGIIGMAVVVLLVSGAGYLYGATTVAPRTTTILGTTTLTESATVTQTSTTISTATWTQTTYLPTPNTGQLGPWSRTSDYPLPPAGLSCVASGGFVYCVGGYNFTAWKNNQLDLALNRTYYASLSSKGVGPWTRATDYPMSIDDENCVANSNYIYCVGGWTSPTGKYVANVYYASLSPLGIGLWKQTTAYPYPTAPQCMTDSSYIYCVNRHYNGTAYTNSVDSFFAHLSPAGVGNWTASTPPEGGSACTASGGYIYCTGGANCPPHPPGMDCPSPSYFAPLSPNGIGNWTRSTDLPAAEQGYFVTAISYGYFFGPPDYYVTRLSSNGTGSWTTSTPYPEAGPASCVASGPYLYCIGGTSNPQTPIPATSAYFAEVG